MRKLQHDRVVKLLGIVLEDGNYSLVMEYVDRGNMMKVLQKVSSELLHPLPLLRVDEMLERDRCYCYLQKIEFLISHSPFCVKELVAALPSLETAEDSSGFPAHHRGADHSYRFRVIES